MLSNRHSCCLATPSGHDLAKQLDVQACTLHCVIHMRRNKVLVLTGSHESAAAPGPPMEPWRRGRTRLGHKSAVIRSFDSPWAKM